MVMKAIYARKPDCNPCIDFYGYDLTDCPACLEALKEEVEIVQIGAGVLHNKAVVKFKSGELGSVRLDELTVIDAI